MLIWRPIAPINQTIEADRYLPVEYHISAFIESLDMGKAMQGLWVGIKQDEMFCNVFAQMSTRLQPPPKRWFLIGFDIFAFS